MTTKLDMQYNTQAEHLVIPEYGRNIQNLINYCKSVEDKEQRQKYAERIVHLMLQMNPQSKNITEYKEKLWNEFFIIADFDIDVIPTEGGIPTREILQKKPEMLAYPHYGTRFRHYGNNVKKMVNKAIDMKEGPIKNGFLNTIGSFMKLAFKTWNKDHGISDDVIKADFKKLSQGKLEIPGDLSLDALNKSSYYKPDSNSKYSKNKKRSNKNYKRRDSNSNNHRRRK